METKPPRVGHKKSRKGCAQCKRRHVKCNEDAPCSNCVRHGVECSLAGGPHVQREDTKERRTSATSSLGVSRTTSQDTVQSFRGISPFHDTPQSFGEIPSQKSPFTVLTGLIDRPVLGQPGDWTMLDLHLMHHYSTHTKDILTEPTDVPNLLEICQQEVPRVAFTADYCMHALLGFSALHKAHLEPLQAPMLRTCAVDHLDKALVQYREHGHPTTAENADAKFIFTWVVALFAFAIPPSVPPIDAMAEVFLLVQGIDTVLIDAWFWVSQGPFAAMLASGVQAAITPDESYNLPESVDYGLGHLDYMLEVESMLPDDKTTCTLVLTELKQMYERVLCRQGQNRVASILSLPKLNSSHFPQLIKRRIPQALVILAYYCVILKSLDDKWWVHGWAVNVLKDVVNELDAQWRPWLDWPVKRVLLEQRPPLDLLTESMVLLM